MPNSPATNPFLYDLTVQGPPELLFIGPRRRKLIAPLRGLVLEIGAGTGLSLRYYEADTSVVATEFDTASLPRLSQRARSTRARVVVAAADAMHLPFPDSTFDGLVCNLALCTIPNPYKALSEAQRVLRPGAPARFLEHVRAGNKVQARVQDFLAPVWSKVAGGCRLNQDTEKVIRESGMQVERVENERGLLLPMKLVWALNK